MRFYHRPGKVSVALVSASCLLLAMASLACQSSNSSGANDSEAGSRGLGTVAMSGQGGALEGGEGGGALDSCTIATDCPSGKRCQNQRCVADAKGVGGAGNLGGTSSAGNAGRGGRMDEGGAPERGGQDNPADGGTAGAMMGVGGKGVAGTSAGVGGAQPALGGTTGIGAGGAATGGVGDAGESNHPEGGAAAGGTDAGGASAAPAGGTVSDAGGGAGAAPAGGTVSDAGGGAGGSAGAAPAGGTVSSAGSSAGGGAGTSNVCSDTPLTGGTPHCSTNDSGSVDNYTWKIWSSREGACITPYGVGAAFSTTWDSPGDLLALVGLEWDATKTYEELGTISADFAHTKSGSGGAYSFIGIYGLTEEPSRELYIVEDSFSDMPFDVGSPVLQTVEIDGGTYDIIAKDMAGAGSDWVQILSIRHQPRTSGHISISKHFKAWTDAGLTLGLLKETMLSVESVGGVGSVDFSCAFFTVE